ncbi:Cilia- and flagella-associated protein 44-like [Oopsacas minuta]|uniref:Cilia- and flagella-associated protein 44 n=1 Tax=Oopsacas minuta TaxID=111878 RepID=A0AAV7KCE5_9METZ|nr:Cilia- and flagella-associated protein 44-like [Oopsacas minuta]
MSETNSTPVDTFQTPKYEYSSLVSSPASHKLSPTFLSFHHSFGYDLLRRCNLYVIDPDTVMYISGNLVHFLTLSTGELSYLRSASGHGLGALAVHPSKQFIAVAEKGVMPVINIFTYPGLRLDRVLRGGTETAYAHLTFSPGDGFKIASVGGSPDFMLTVWDWRHEAIVLRTKAFSQDIFRVSFSPENEGILTSSGIGHIRFWKMAFTFTGLKLQGDIGKFGKREISDVSGYAEFPDGKVLSGSEWGNLLLWEGDLVKVELCRKNQKPCHVGNIEFVFLDEGEIITGGADGIIRIWDFEEIDQADVIDDNDLIEIIPLQEVKLATRTGASVKHLAKLNDPDTPTYWVVQDNKGSIWRVDLQVSHTHKPPERLYTFHSGSITGLAVSLNSLHAVTCGLDGRVRLYDIEAKKFLGRTTFNMAATCVAWLPLWFDAFGLSVIAGFCDGIIRLLHITGEDGQSPLSTDKIEDDSSFTLKQVLKPHSKPVTAILLGDNCSNLNLVTSADDSIFFMLQKDQSAKRDTFIPLGFMSIEHPVVNLAWAPSNTKDKFTVLASLNNASVLLITIPSKGEFDISTSYKLEGVLHQIFRFKSVKYEILKAARDIELEAEKAKKLKQVEEDGPPSTTSLTPEDEQEIDPYADLPAPPEIPSPILHAFYHGHSNNFWLCMDSYDSEYLYECWISPDGPDPDGDRPLKVLPVPKIFGAIQPITTLNYTQNKEYIIIGTSNGQIQIHKVNINGNLSLDQFWAIPMSDPDAKVTRVCTTYNDQYILATSEDGNFFSFKVEERQLTSASQYEISNTADIDISAAKDIEDPKHYSLEEARQRAENDRKLKLAEEQKKQVIAQVNKLRKQFKQFQSRNNSLPSHIQLGEEEFIMDKQAVEDFNTQTIESLKMVELQQQWLREKYIIGYDKLYNRYKAQLQSDTIIVYSFTSDDVMTRTLRCLKRTDRDNELLNEVRSQTSESFRYSSRMLPSSNQHVYNEKSVIPLASRKISIKTDVSVDKQGKGESLRLQRKQRSQEWAQLIAEKPQDNYQHPDDIVLLHDAETNMGDFKLKTSSDYTVPEDLRMNASKKRIQLVLLRQEIQYRSELFNEKVIELRNEKVAIIDRFTVCLERLKEIQLSLPKEDQLSLPIIPHLRPEEVPEKSLEFNEKDLLHFEKNYQKKLEARAKAKQGGEELGGFGGFGTAAPIDQPDDVDSSSEAQSSIRGSLTDLGDPEDLDGKKYPKSKAEQSLRYEMLTRLKYERDSLLREIETAKKAFDVKVRYLSNYKIILDSQIKLSDLRHVLLFEEYLLLKDFEKREQNFISKLKGKQKDRQDMQTKLNTLKEQTETKQISIHHGLENLKELEEEFQREIANNKFADFLLRVFKKKIKRVKQVEKKEEGESSDEESDSDLESDISSDEGSEAYKEKAFDDTTCPQGCQVALFDKACELRESRMDLEEQLSEDKKSLELLKKDSENSVKKARVMDNAVKNAKSDLENFQLEKQHRLNELEVLVLLRISQILVGKPNSDPPPNLKNTLVFSESNLNRLNMRAGEIREEQLDLRRQRKDLEAKKQRLSNDKKTMVTKVQELESQVDEIMMLKFGRKVDLEFFDPVEPSKNVLEMREQIGNFEKQARQELIVRQEEIDLKKQELDEVLQLNTRRLRTLTQLMGKMSEYESKLEIGEKQLGSEFQSPESHLTSDNAELSNLVKMQAVQIEGLNHEIRILSLKTGHVPPPRPPPVPSPLFMKQTPT